MEDLKWRKYYFVIIISKKFRQYVSLVMHKNCEGQLYCTAEKPSLGLPTAKSFIEVTSCTCSNIMVWFGRDTSEIGVAGLTECLIFSLFAKGLEKYAQYGK
jgi:hypothetical protein